jgi:hypothetical protein
VTASVKVVAILSGVLTASCWSAAFAGDRGDWFKRLRIPGTKASCCDIADCHRTEADWRDGEWWAVVNDEWRQVPQSKVLTSPPSIDGSAYICTGTPNWSMGRSPAGPLIYCFVPPNWPV